MIFKSSSIKNALRSANKVQGIIQGSLFMVHTVGNTHKHFYRKTSNISHTSVGDEIVDNSDAVGALPVGAAPTTYSFST